jgi:hypothetical protein
MEEGLRLNEYTGKCILQIPAVQISGFPELISELNSLSVSGSGSQSGDHYQWIFSSIEQAARGIVKLATKAIDFILLGEDKSVLVHSLNGKVIYPQYEGVHYFKKFQRDGIFHYYKVFGGPGKTKDGYQEVINFLNPVPSIYIERNYESDPDGIAGTWITFEFGIPISREEYQQAFNKATAGEFKIK